MSPLNSMFLQPPLREHGDPHLTLPRGKDPHRLVLLMIGLLNRINDQTFDWGSDPVNLANILKAEGYESVPAWPEEISQISERWNNPAQLTADRLDPEQATLQQLSKAIKSYLNPPRPLSAEVPSEPDPHKIF